MMYSGVVVSDGIGKRHVNLNSVSDGRHSTSRSTDEWIWISHGAGNKNWNSSFYFPGFQFFPKPYCAILLVVLINGK